MTQTLKMTKNLKCSRIDFAGFCLPEGYNDLGREVWSKMVTVSWAISDIFGRLEMAFSQSDIKKG
jgi:hypothetical protein